MVEVEPWPVVAGSMAVVAAGPTWLRVRWTAPGDDGSEGRAARYDIRYAAGPLTADGTLVRGWPGWPLAFDESVAPAHDGHT